ncbi:MAG: threonine synthase [Chloroflexi bacterium]|nr:threonine synthase [Chloroflexota bacterium]
MSEQFASAFTHLECSACHERYDPQRLHNVCPACGKPLLARYDLEKAASSLTRESLQQRPPGLWRYWEVLPVQDRSAAINLGEGGTPLLCAPRLGDRLAMPNTFIKDETSNPTGSFKARGLCLAVSRAYELGAKEIAIPSAGNAAGAMSAYAAAVGMPAHVFMPVDTPPAFAVECRTLGAEVTLIQGLITDCGAEVKAGVQTHGWFDVSTLKEPYRLEGKKTMGYELAEQLDWNLPDVIIYPTGGGTGLVGMWKAFAEMEAMGLIGPQRPRMVSVQSDGCAPIVRAYQEGSEHAEVWQNAATIASGLRVPAAIGDFLMLEAIRDSGGTAIAVSDEEMMRYADVLGSTTGIFSSPEGAACLAAQVHLLEAGWLRPDDVVVNFITGTGLKYTHLWQS